MNMSINSKLHLCLVRITILSIQSCKCKAKGLANVAGRRQANWLEKTHNQWITLISSKGRNAGLVSKKRKSFQNNTET